MDRKIDAGALLVAAAAALLVVSLFLDWFGVGGDTAISAWEAFEVLDLVLVLAAGAAVAAAFGRVDQRVLLAAAVVVLVVVVSQLIEPPPAGQGADREVGAWLALVAAFGLLAGAALTSAQIAVTVDVRGRERRRRVATVDKRTDAAPAGGAPVSTAKAASAGGAPVSTKAAPAAAGDDPEPTQPTAADSFAPPADPDATQAFSVRSDGEPER